jgi:hypothetical protein
MALYAFDGTWNIRKDGDDPDYRNTNVVRFFDAYHARSNTRDVYVEGIGTRYELAGRIIGGMFGLGELPRMNEAYDRLCRNWADGDRVIDVVGFSRGAATTLDFCHMIQDRGIRSPGSEDVVEARPQIRFVGLWDVVPAFGLGFLGNQLLNLGHDLELPESRLRYCFHALALDEQRLPFIPTRLSGAHEVWFRGVHSDIGGGNGNRGLNDITLKWMLRKARAAGLPIADAHIQALQGDPSADPNPKLKLLDIRNIAAVDRRHHTAADRDGWRCAPATCGIETDADEDIAVEVGAAGIGVTSLESRRRVLVLWETARQRAEQEHHVTLHPVREDLIGLIQGRIALVTDDDETLRRARVGTAMLVDLMMDAARQRGWHEPRDFFLNAALAGRRHLFPYTD